MPKAILEFDLNDIDDASNHKRAVVANDMMSVLLSVDNYLRGQLKYNENLTKEQYNVLQETRDFLNREMTERNLNFDM